MATKKKASAKKELLSCNHANCFACTYAFESGRYVCQVLTEHSNDKNGHCKFEKTQAQYLAGLEGKPVKVETSYDQVKGLFFTGNRY